MKKIGVFLCIIVCLHIASAQSFEIGLKGGGAATTLVNDNVNNAGMDQDPKYGTTTDFGVHAQFNFNKFVGIELEGISEAFKQGYTGTFESPSGSKYGFFYNNPASGSNALYIQYGPGESYTATTTLNEIKVPLLIHITPVNAFGIEIGPQWADITNATYTATYSGNPRGTPASLSYSTKSDFTSSNIAIVAGLGWNIKVIDQLYLLTDIRFEYGLTDLIGTDGHGEDLNQNLNNGSLYMPSQFSNTVYSYSTYNATSSLEVNVNIGLFYRIPLGDK